MQRSSYTREKVSPRNSILRSLVEGIVLLVSFVASIALILTLLVPHIDPAISWIFPVLGLIAPAVYIVNLILALYWIITWRLSYAIPMVFLLLFGVGSISLFINMEFSKDYGLENYSKMPKILSYNIRLFINDDKQWSTKELAQYLEDQKADIICLQEYEQRAKALKSEMGDKLRGFSKAQYNTLVIYSRYPIIKKGNIFENDTTDIRRSIWADVLIKDDTIRIFNNHLHSTTIKAEDDAYLTSRQIIRDTLRRDKISDMLLRFSQGSVERDKQIDTISTVIKNSPHPVVVCGDFNDTPISRTYSKMSKGLKDAFQESGKGYSYTYRGFYNTLRIDYILTGEGITPHNYQVDEECTLSDHLPIMSHIEIH